MFPSSSFKTLYLLHGLDMLARPENSIASALQTEQVRKAELDYPAERTKHYRGVGSLAVEVLVILGCLKNSMNTVNAPSICPAVRGIV